jgi:hypothetical protein
MKSRNGSTDAFSFFLERRSESVNEQIRFSPPPTNRKKHHGKRSLAVLLVIASLIILGVFYALIKIVAAYENSAKLVEEIKPDPSAVELYSLSTDQATIVAQYGHPDSFTITFYREEFDPYYSGEVRDEIWRYYSNSTEYVFYNGKLMYVSQISDPPTNWIALPYQPEQFTAYASLKTILASASISSFFELPLEKELVDQGDLFFAPGLTFGTVNDRLVYVETVMMDEEGN